jgi:uncharacterized protein YjbI with pentapeptide repeats
MKVKAKVVGHVKIDPNDYVNVEHARLTDEDYSGRKLKQFCAVGCRFERCRFERMRVDNFVPGAGMELSEYAHCSFDSIRVSRMGGGFARFVRCSFKNVEIRDWHCYKTEFVDCIFTGHMEECIFNGTVPEKDRSWVGREKNEFRGNDFSGCELVDVAFRTGIDLSQQRLPTGPEYLYLPDAAVAIERARTSVQEWYDAALREAGMTFLISIESELQGGQRQLLLHADDYYGCDSLPREMVDGVFAALRSD